MLIKDILTEDIDKDTFVKLLKQKGTYDITNTGSKFEATIIEPYGSETASKILKTQQAKIDTAAKVMGVTWKILYANQFSQNGGYMNRKANRPVWTYVLVGEDSKGNEVSYWKYEGAVAGGGQSHVFVNKDKNSKEKLSNIIDPKNKNWASKYIQQSIAAGAKREADKAALKGKKKLTVDELGELLQKSVKLKNILAKHNARLVKPKDLNWRVVKMPKTDKGYGRAYIFKPSNQGRVKLLHSYLDGKRELKRGYSDFGGATDYGVHNTLNDAISRMMIGFKYY